MDEQAVKGCVDARAVWLAEVLDGDREPARYGDYTAAWLCLGLEERCLVLALTRGGIMPYFAT
jgi:hypothetical protein